MTVVWGGGVMIGAAAAVVVAAVVVVIGGGVGVGVGVGTDGVWVVPLDCVMGGGTNPDAQDPVPAQ